MKLFVSDMDGTLLNADFNISPANIRAIQRLSENNIIFAVATGRIFHDAVTICRNHQLSPYIISNNGACIFDTEGNQIYGKSMAQPQLRAVVEYLEELEVCYGVGGSMTYVTPPRWESILDREISQLAENGIHIPEHKVTFTKYEMTAQNGFCEMDPLKEADGGKLTGYSVSVVSHDDEKMRQITAFVERFPDLTATAAGSHSMEIMKRDGTKGDALRYLAGMLGIPDEEIGAIGDSFNDISMLKIAGTAIAMGNAKEEIKRMCSVTAKACADDGFAHAVEELLG